MKSSRMFLIVFLAIICFESRQCFLPYPFIASDVLDQVLDSLHVTDRQFDKDLMKHAVDGEKCVRECRENDRKICFYNFTLKHYQILGG